MKKFFSLLMASALIFISADAQAQSSYDSCCEDTCCENSESFYVEVLGGGNFLQTEERGGVKYTYQPGYIVSGSLGYRWCNGLRVEAEYAFRRNHLRKVHFFGHDFSTDGHFQSSSYMANLLWDFSLSNWGCEDWKIKPFIGAGIGYDFQQIHSGNGGLTFNESKKHFAWQLMAGLAYPLFCNTDISLEYKFHKGGFSHLYSHSVGVGLMYHFGAGY